MLAQRVCRSDQPGSAIPSTYICKLVHAKQKNKKRKRKREGKHTPLSIFYFAQGSSLTRLETISSTEKVSEKIAGGEVMIYLDLQQSYVLCSSAPKFKLLSSLVVRKDGSIPCTRVIGPCLIGRARKYKQL